MRYLLDTHTWLWWAQGELMRFSPGLLAAMQKAEKVRELGVSAMTLWELAMLESKARIELGSECRLWLENALVRTRVTLIPMTPAIAVDSTRLPGDFHGDPSDRLIVATTRAENAILLTNDRKILDYAAGGAVRARPLS